MEPEQFLEELSTFAQSEGGVQKLRDLILELAVRGKLVPQDPNDEPASVLLERSRQEQTRLQKVRQIKKPKPVKPLPPEEMPHAIPTNWEWARLGDAVAVLDFIRKPIKKGDRLARVAGKHQDDLFPYYGATQQAGWIDEYLFDEELVLLGEDGAPFFKSGKHVAYIVSGRFWVNNHAHALRTLAGLNKYLCYVLNQCSYDGFVSGTTRLKLTQGKMVNLPIPLPPLAEQHRIVAKVESLMALCDQLEQSQTAAMKLQESYSLAEAMVN